MLERILITPLIRQVTAKCPQHPEQVSRLTERVSAWRSAGSLQGLAGSQVLQALNELQAAVVVSGQPLPAGFLMVDALGERRSAYQILHEFLDRG